MLTKEAFAEKLKRAIDEKGITQAELAKTVGTSPANISNYVKAKAFPPVDILVELAKALEKSLDWLCNKGKKNRDFINIETVGDAARIVEALKTLGEVRATWTNYQYRGDTVYFPAIEFCGGELQKFIEDEHKMLEILQAGTIEKTLFDRWMQDRMNALDYIPASSKQDEFQELDDELLPF